jgi:hypothetical protein
MLRRWNYKFHHKPGVMGPLSMQWWATPKVHWSTLDIYKGNTAKGKIQCLLHLLAVHVWPGISRYQLKYGAGERRRGLIDNMDPEIAEP